MVQTQMITYIPQRSNWDCGIASLAMATGNTYDKILADIAGDRVEPLNELHLFDWMFNNGWAWQQVYQNFPLHGQYKKRAIWPPMPFAPSHIALVGVPAGAHFTVMDAAGKVFDPFKRERETLAHHDYQQVHCVLGLWPVALAAPK